MTQRKLTILVLFVAGVLLPFATYAHTPFPHWGPLLSCDWDTDPMSPTAGDLPDCASFCDMVHTAIHITQFLLTVGILGILPIAILVSGFFIMTAGGSPERLSRGRNAAKGVGIGLAIAIGAYLIVGAILFTLGAATTSSGGLVGWPDISC